MNRILATALATVVAVLLLLLHFYRPSAGGLWMHTFFESLHVPVFAAISMCIYWIFRISARQTLLFRVLAVMTVCCALGAGSEYAQISTPRDASVEDLLHDILGAAAGLFLMMGFAERKRLTKSGSAFFIVAGLAIGVGSVWPLVEVSAAYLERYSNKPALVSFGDRYGGIFRRTQHASLSIEPDPATGEYLGRIRLLEGPWPGLIFHDVWPDWRSYSNLIVELELDATEPLEVNLRVHDRQHRLGNQPYADRFNMTYSLPPGAHDIVIPLSSIRQAPRDREMDMSTIDGIMIFCGTGNAGREFTIRQIRLE